MKMSKDMIKIFVIDEHNGLILKGTTS